MEHANAERVTRRGIAIIGIAALLVAGIGIGVAEGGKKQPVLTKKQAKKIYLSKKAADSSFQKIEKTLQIPASMAGFTGDPDTDYQDTNGADAGARHLNSGFGSIGWSFILPPHYPAGAALTVKVYYTVPGATGCSFWLEPNSLSVSNIGGQSVGSQNDIGNPGDTHAAPPVGQAASINWTIPGTVQGQQLRPGTAVTFGTFRNSTLAEDTCASPVAIKGHEVSWG